jgi:hypothetical protein
VENDLLDDLEGILNEEAKISKNVDAYTNSSNHGQLNIGPKTIESKKKPQVRDSFDDLDDLLDGNIAQKKQFQDLNDLDDILGGRNKPKLLAK